MEKKGGKQNKGMKSAIEEMEGRVEGEAVEGREGGEECGTERDVDEEQTNGRRSRRRERRGKRVSRTREKRRRNKATMLLSSPETRRISPRIILRSRREKLLDKN